MKILDRGYIIDVLRKVFPSIKDTYILPENKQAVAYEESPGVGGYLVYAEYTNSIYILYIYSNSSVYPGHKLLLELNQNKIITCAVRETNEVSIKFFLRQGFLHMEGITQRYSNGDKKLYFVRPAGNVGIKTFFSNLLNKLQ